MTMPAFLNARQFRSREVVSSPGVSSVANDLRGPIHAVSTAQAVDADGLRALCGVAVIVTRPVCWPPTGSGAAPCRECRRRTREAAPQHTG